MKTLIKYFAAAAALLALAACSKLPGQAKKITVQAGIGALTKVAADGDNASFEAGDQIAVYAWLGDKTAVPAERVVDGVANTLGADGKWTPATPMLWKNATSAHYFLGVWPVHTVTSFTADAYTLNPADQKASDLLLATNLTGLTPSSTPVALAFSHAMARLDVNLSFRNQWESTPTVTSVSATAKKTATVNLLTAAVTATGDAAKVVLAKKSDAAWSGLQVPQTGVRTITVTIDGKDFVFTHTGDIPLTAGKYTTVNLTVGRDRIDLGSMTINNWVAGSTIDGGEAQDD